MLLTWEIGAIAGLIPIHLYLDKIIKHYHLQVASLLKQHAINTFIVIILILRVGYKNNSCIRETQENSIRNSLQNSLSYILLQMVCANYCAPYSKWLCGVHVVWHHLVPEPSMTFSQVPWLMLWPHHQMWLMWLITSNPNPRVLKIEKWKINQDKK